MVIPEYKLTLSITSRLRVLATFLSEESSSALPMDFRFFVEDVGGWGLDWIGVVGID
jgi:hypothetical protein